MSFVLFEDDLGAQFAPLAYMRPVHELRVGALNLRERCELATGSDVYASVPKPLAQVPRATLPVSQLAELGSARVVLLNSRVLATVDELQVLLESESDEAAWQADVLIAVSAKASEAAAILADPSSVRNWKAWTKVQALRTAAHTWELVHANEEFLSHDFATLAAHGAPLRRTFGFELDATSKRREWMKAQTLNRPMFSAESGIHVLGNKAILLGSDVRIKPGVVLDAEDGPIILSAGVSLAPHVSVQGPAFLGPGTVVNPGTRVREGTSVGCFCKLGGELEELVMLDFSNKQHDGFLGHAYVGSWVNLGADTNGSDLKNNYGPVRVDLGDGPVDTGQRFVGPALGDHAKTGINTMLSTGAVVGVAANVFGGGFPPRFLPSFSWGGVEGLDVHDREKAIATAKVVMERRDVTMTPEYERLLEHVYQITRRHR